MRLKALALVFLVFSATFVAAYMAFAAKDFRTDEKEIDFVQPPSIIHVSNDTLIRPNEPIDTPGGPT